MINLIKDKIHYQPVNPVVIGRIAKAYGILGWVKIVSFTDKTDDIFRYNPWFILIKSQWQVMRLDRWRLIGKCYIAKIKEVINRELAMLLAHHDLFVDNTQFPSLDNGEYYWKDIMQCQVMTIKGFFLGTVVNILETGVYDILVVRLNSNNTIKEKDFFIPFVRNKIVKVVDLVASTIIVDWNINF